LIAYERARASDLAAIANLYQDSFPEALSAVFGRPRLPDSAVEDVFALLYKEEPGGFEVARDDGKLVGCVVSVRSFADLKRRLLRRGLRRLAARWLRGRYRGLGLGWIPRLAQAAWRYRQADAAAAEDPDPAQMLTAIVASSHRGQGIGAHLIERSLASLKISRVKSVRLEVDAAKPGPIHLYRKLGFREIARIPTPRGPALVLSRPL